MRYRLRIVYLAGGQCRIQKRHWLKTLGFWVTLTYNFGEEYYLCSEKKAKEYIKDYYETFDNYKVIRYEEQ